MLNYSVYLKIINQCYPNKCNFKNVCSDSQLPYLWLSNPRLGTSSSQLWIIVWLAWKPQSPAQVGAICRLLCCSGWVALGRTQVVADPGLQHLGNSRACIPSGQLQTMLEHHLPAPAQLILHGGWRLVVSGHSQSLQLTGLGKFLPLTCNSSQG